MTVFISTFAIAAHAILCPNDTLDNQLFTRIFTQRWLFLFGYSSYEEFTGTYEHFTIRSGASCTVATKDEWCMRGAGIKQIVRNLEASWNGCKNLSVIKVD